MRSNQTGVLNGRKKEKGKKGLAPTNYKASMKW